MDTLFDVHFGIENREFDSRLLYEGGAHWGTDDDGWNAWGEAPGTETNDADTIHVVVNCGTLGQAIDLALRYGLLWEEDALPLVPSTGVGERQRNNLVSVTRHDDWSHEHLLITTTGARTIANIVTL